MFSQLSLLLALTVNTCLGDSYQTLKGINLFGRKIDMIVTVEMQKVRGQSNFSMPSARRGLNKIEKRCTLGILHTRQWTKCDGAILNINMLIVRLVIKSHKSNEITEIFLSLA